MIAACERWVDQLRVTEQSVLRAIGELPALSPDLNDAQRVLTQVEQARVAAEKLALRLNLDARQQEKTALQSEIDDLQSRLAAL